ncbi:MAG: ABC transporter ATP-binding protein/permease [Planctomycetota bacterium]|nr:ABC transporter ATP-binding protein/permease [Planctomycetota bacterium]
MRHASADLMHDEKSLRKAIDVHLIRRLWRYVRPYRGAVAGSFALLFAVSAVQLVQPYLVKLAIDRHIATREFAGLGGLAALFLAVLSAEFALRYAQMFVLERTGQHVIFDIRMHVFSHLQALPSAFFDRNSVGKLMTRVTSDVEALNEAFTSGLVLILADLVKLAGIVVILLWMDWRLALVTFAVLPPMLWLTFQFRTRVRRAYRAVRARVAQLNAFLQENVSGIRLVQLFNRQRASIDAFAEVNDGHLGAQLRGVRYDSTFSALAEMIGSWTVAAIVWAGGRRILSRSMTFGTLVAFIDYAEKFFRPVQELSQRYTTMQAAMASAERIFELLDTEVTIRSPERPKSLPAQRRGEIVFEGVHFGYEPGVPVLRDVSFRLAPGERGAIVGWTGSGKSTLIRLLVRLYDPWEGRILLDGVDVRELDLQTLRRTVGVVLQEPFLFADSIRRNLDLGDPAVDEARVRRAAEAVTADRFIERLADGYETEVRERGANFSTGEKQLMSFARALAFDPAVLIMDEATASVDPATESRIQTALARVLEGRTSIVIAHRLATVRDADRIFVLHHGSLVEQGTHEELAAVEGGIYAALYRYQAVGGSLG